MDILFSEASGFKVVAIEDFDFDTATSILKHVRGKAEDFPVALEFSGDSHIEHASIGVLIEMLLSRGRNADKISLVNPSAKLLKSLHKFRIDQFFDIKLDRKSA